MALRCAPRPHAGDHTRRCSAARRRCACSAAPAPA